MTVSTIVNATNAPAAPDSNVTKPKQPIALRIAPLLTIVAILTLSGLTTVEWSGWTTNRRLQSTQNAYVKADIATLSAKISGQIRSLPIEDYQFVAAGTLLANIDEFEYRIQLISATANLEKVEANLANLSLEEAQQKASISQAEANLIASQVRLHQYELELARQEELVNRGSSSRKAFEEAQADRDTAISSRDASSAALSLAKTQLNVLQGQRGLRVAERDGAKAEVEAAKLKLSDTRIVAPFDGVITHRRVQLGNLVSNGTQIVSLVPVSQPFVVSNYKETQLTHVRAGQPVELRVDAFPGRRFAGRVSEISPVTAAETALVPADNASGNFTKVIQRISVRIDIDPAQPGISDLRPGMSVETIIDTAGQDVVGYPKKEDVRISQAAEIADGN